MADWLEHHYGAKIDLIEVDAYTRGLDFERVPTNELKAARFELYYFNDPVDRNFVWVRQVHRVYYEPVEDEEFRNSSLIARHIDIVRIPAEDAGALSEDHWRRMPSTLLPNVLKYSRFELRYCQDAYNPAYTLCKGRYRIDYPPPARPAFEAIPGVRPSLSLTSARKISPRKRNTPTKRSTSTSRVQKTSAQNSNHPSMTNAAPQSGLMEPPSQIPKKRGRKPLP